MPNEKQEGTWMKRLRHAWETDHKTCLIVAAGLSGVVLLAVSCLFGGEEAAVSVAAYDARQYTCELEERLESMVSSVRGAGLCDVMVTLENGVEYIYANEEKTNSDRTQSGDDVSTRDDNQKTVVTVDAADGRQGLLVTEIQPTVRGVVVACEGAADGEVAALVREAVRTALNITDRRVCVIPLS